MNDDCISLRRELIEVLPTFEEGVAHVLLVLVARNQQQKSLKIGLTLQELARTANVSAVTAERALNILIDRSCITLTKGTKYDTIEVLEYWIGEKPTPIPYTPKNTDETKLKKMEAEIRRLELQQTRKTESGLAAVLQGEEADLIIEIEGRTGCAVSVIDAYLLGKGVSRFGPERMKTTWRKLQRNKNPIRGTYAALMNGAKGKAAGVVESQPFQNVTYKEIE